MKAGIIAAGEGARLRAGGFSMPKPLVPVGGMTLLERTLRALVENGVEEVALIARDREVLEHAAGLDLPVPIRSVMKITPSSMHSLYELGVFLGRERFLLCTVDSIIRPVDFAAFADTFRRRSDAEVLLSYTDFVDDENPLRIAVAEQDGRVTALGAAAAGSPFVTVGLYGFGPAAFVLLPEALSLGIERLRNFLGFVLQKRLSLAGFRLTKAIDVDRLSDVEVAEAFLRDAGP